MVSSPDRQIARDVFLKAIEFKQDSDRQEFIDQACAHDANLRRKVMALVAASEEPGSFLEHPAANFEVLATAEHSGPIGEEPDPDTAASPGTTIGPYKLLQEVGRGGFGVVYMAEQQEPVRRTVALKIIKPGMDTREVIARFEAERQALALMDHPNIARVLDAGTTSQGRPFFVMELVKGVPITEFCDKNGLSPQKRLELFVTVCRAVQHAHQKGVIHRDLKPSNVMITLHDGKPVPKIIDFGISKATAQKLTEKTLFTRYGQMVGTPQYMSPEQAEMSGLDVDTRSDVYSLGVLLYELLTGTTPLEVPQLREAGYAEMLRLIQESEAPKPSTRVSTLNDQLLVVCENRKTSAQQLGHFLRGDLDWIVMKALDKDRSRRYESVTAFADDIGRHLRDEPVSAGAPSSVYLLQKLIRRNRTLVATLVAIAASVLVGLGLAVAGLVEADQKRQLASSKEQEAQAAREVAINERDRAEQARDEAVVSADEARRSRAVAEEARARLELQLYDTAVLQAAETLAMDVLQTHQALDSCNPDLRHWEWRRLKAQAPRVNEFLAGETELSSGALDPLSDPADPAYLSVDQNGIVALRKLHSGEIVWQKSTDIPGPVLLEFSPNGKLISLATHFRVSISEGRGELEIWDREGKKLWERTAAKPTSFAAAFSPDGLYYCVSEFSVQGGMSGGVKVHRTADDSLVWEKKAVGMNMANFSLDSRRLFFCQARNTDTSSPAGVKCFDVESGERVWTVVHSSTGLPVPHPDGKHVILGGHNHDLTFYDLETGELTDQLRGFMPDDAPIVQISPDGKSVITMGSFGHAAFWDLEKRHVVGTFRHEQRYSHIPMFKLDSSGYLVLGADKRRVVVTDFKGGKPDVSMQGHTSAVLGLAVQGETLWSADGAGILREWDASSGLEQAASSRFGNIGAVGFQKDYVVAANRSTVQVLQDGVVKTLASDVSNGALRQIEFGAEGRLMAIGYSRALEIWETEAWKLRSRASFDNFVDGFCFTDDDEVAVVLSQAGVVMLQLSTGQKTVLRDTDPISSARVALWLPASDRLAVSVDQRVEIWDLVSRERTMTLNNDLYLITSLAVSPDEKRLFVGNSAGQISVWNLDSQRRVYGWRAHGSGSDRYGNGVTDLLISEDGSTLYSSGSDGRVKVWESSRPSTELVEKRALVGGARKVLDRYAGGYGSDQFLSELRKDSSISPAVLSYAIQIAEARGELVQHKKDENAIGDRLTAVNLSPDWPQTIRAQRQHFLRAADQFAAAVEEIIGAPLDQASADNLDVATWIQQSNELTKLPIGQDEMERLLAELMARHSESSLLYHLRASLHASHSRWEQAARDLRQASELAPANSDLRVGLLCQLGLLSLYRGEVENAAQIRDELIGGGTDSLPPRIRLRLARFILTGEPTEAALKLAVELVRNVPEETLQLQELPWLGIARARGAALAGDHAQAVSELKEVLGAIPGGPYGNYARVAAGYYQGMAADQIQDSELRKRSNGLVSFVQTVQPFTRPDAKAPHRLWEDWLCSVLAGRSAKRD